jgi:phenylacetate-CoA ligase
MPLLRFKTGDAVTYTDEPCKCGRKTIRLKVMGRSDDMILIKGTNVYPAAIEDMVKSCPDLGHEFMIVIDEINGVYELIIQVEPSTQKTCTVSEVQQMQNTLVEKCRENLRLRPVVKVMEYGSLPRFEVKSKRVMDKRPNE